MEDFLSNLESAGYSKNTLSTYRRVLRHFHSFLKLYRCSIDGFNEEELAFFLRGYYKTPASMRTAVSAIKHYLRFKGIVRKLNLALPEQESFKEFRPIPPEEMERLKELASSASSKELRLALLLCFCLGLSPAEITKLKVSSFGMFLDIPVLQEGRIKRFILSDTTLRELKAVREEKEPFSRLVSAPVATVKTAIYRVLKRSGYTLSIADFKDNYIAQLLKRGLPFDIVVEFSSSNLERVSYINRVIMLKSKADFIEESLKSGGVK